ncbi:T9SS type A sorting domain-containing protein [soil metagenome]
MKKFLLPIIFLFIGINSASAQKWVAMMEDPSVNFYDVQKEFYAYYVNKTKVLESEPRMDGPYHRFKRWEHYMEPRVYPTGIRPDPMFIYAEWLKQKAYISKNRAPANWTFIGPSQLPTNGGGAGITFTVAIDPTDSQNLWLATGGGLWNSTDGGNTWSTNTDQQLPALGISDVIIDPSNVNNMFIGVNPGVFKSTDGGTTWNSTGLTQFCTRVTMDPSNSNILIAACADGIYRTTDAAATWTLVLPTSGLSNSIRDLEFNPATPNTVYACGYSQILRSANNGITWTVITAGLPSSPFGIKLAVSPANPNYVYALMTSYVFPASNGFYAMCRSTDAGLTWTSMSTTPNIMGYDITGATAGGQGSYCMAIAVSPLNENEVYVGGINVWKSSDGGVTWTIKTNWTGTGATAVHADQQGLQFQPGSGTVIYSCNDGGINVSNDAGATWTNLSNGLEIMQINKLGNSASNANIIAVGTQDNGSNKSSSGVATNIGGGDGFECIIDNTDSNTIYTSYQNGAIFRSIDGGTTNISITPASSSNFYTYYSMNPLNSKTLYAPFAELYRSYNKGTTWTAITSGVFPAMSGAFHTPAVVAASDTNTIYVGRLTTVYKTTNGGSTWTNMATGLPPAAYVTSMTVHPTNANILWATFSGYGSYSTTSNDKVFQSTDGGLTWTNITGLGLPAVAVNCIVYQNGSPDALYAATDLGVYYIDNTMSNWIPYNSGLPNVRVTEIEIQYGVGKLRAGTYGRGLWETDLNVAVVNTNDAGISTVISPTATICTNNITPVVKLKNFGSATLTSTTIQYQVDGGTVNTFAWTGSIASFGSTNVTLPAITVTPGAHIFHSNTILPNAVVDINNSNDSTNFAFNYVTGLPLPFTEGFESITFPPAGFSRNNFDGGITWQRTTLAAKTGIASAFMDDMNYANDAMIDELILPNIDLTSTASPAMTFEMAYQLRANPLPSNSYSDTLKVQVSTDCGLTWTQVFKKFDIPLVTTTPIYNTSVTYIPATSTTAAWRLESIDLSPFTFSNGVLIKIINVNGRGNNLYIDDINLLDIPLGINSGAFSQIDVYPNPGNGEFTFAMQHGKPGTELKIYNVLGELIYTTTIASGTNAIDISKQASGMYFYKVVSEGRAIANGKLMLK